MIHLETELARIRNAFIAKKVYRFMIDRAAQNGREILVCAMTADILRMKGEDHPVFAHHCSPPDPDLMTYTASRTPFKPMEITEAHRPERKRADEYRELLSGGTALPRILHPIRQHPQIWSTLLERLENKFTKRYQRDCWLLIWNTPSFGEISCFGTWEGHLLAALDAWDNRPEGGLRLADSPYERILVINTSGKALVEIFPEKRVIRSEMEEPDSSEPVKSKPTAS